MTKKMIEYKPALMNISSPPCIAKEEGDVLDCYFFASSNVNLNRSVMGKMITNSWICGLVILIVTQKLILYLHPISSIKRQFIFCANSSQPVLEAPVCCQALRHTCGCKVKYKLQRTCGYGVKNKLAFTLVLSFQTSPQIFGRIVKLLLVSPLLTFWCQQYAQWVLSMMLYHLPLALQEWERKEKVG